MNFKFHFEIKPFFYNKKTAEIVDNMIMSRISVTKQNIMS